MFFCACILFNVKYNSYYIDCANNQERMLKEHNVGKNFQ